MCLWFLVQKPVLFLDIDGVLFLDGPTLDGLYDSDPFDKQCVSGLNAIIEKTDCEIVVTSLWQNEYTLEQLREIFAWNGVIPAPMQVSSPDPSVFGTYDNRSKEILAWIGSHTKATRTNRFRWCAVDDLNLSVQLENFVQCDPEVGLGDRAVVMKAIDMLESFTPLKTPRT